jgi:hypothetical protein
MISAIGMSHPSEVLNGVHKLAHRQGLRDPKHILVHPVRSGLESLEDLVLVDGNKHEDKDDNQRDDGLLWMENQWALGRL